MKIVNERIMKLFCEMAKRTAPYATKYCRGKFYQPLEPKGLVEFAKKWEVTKDEGGK